MRVDFILFKYKNYLLAEENNPKCYKDILGDDFSPISKSGLLITSDVYWEHGSSHLLKSRCWINIRFESMSKD